jgi:hypothetical protein
VDDDAHEPHQSGLGQVAELPSAQLATSLLVYDGPHHHGVYERSSPLQHRRTDQGDAEVWLSRR